MPMNHTETQREGGDKEGVVVRKSERKREREREGGRERRREGGRERRREGRREGGRKNAMMSHQ